MQKLFTFTYSKLKAPNHGFFTLFYRVSITPSSNSISKIRQNFDTLINVNITKGL